MSAENSVHKAVNASIAAERGGEAQPLVLIRGGNMDRRMWDEQFAAFAKTYKVIRYAVVNEDVGDLYSKHRAKVDEVFRVY